MTDIRHLSDEPTKDLHGAPTQQQASIINEVQLFPSLGTLSPGIEIADRYLVENEIAMIGGEADVFCCRDKETGRKVAVKVYRAEIRPKEELLQKLQTLDHEHLIKLLAFGMWSDRFFEAMEFAEGGALTSEMPYTEDFIEKVILPQVTGGLECLHNHKIIHRDLKPPNLFFRDTARRKVIIADYGISSLLEDWEGSRRVSTSLKGTADFTAPEAFSGTFGKEIDYYSLGITLLVLRCGESPFAGMTEQQKMYYHLTERIHPPQDCSKRFADLVAGLLCKERRERWGYDEVQGWLRGEQVHVPEFAPAKKSLDYRLTKDQIAHTIEELGELMIINTDEAKKHISKRLIYEHIRGIDPYLASCIDDIQSEASNMEECLVEVAYTLNPKLPYHFIEGIEVGTPAQLARLIDRDQRTWEAGKEQIANGMIPAWLRATDYGELVEQWKNVESKFLSK